MFKNNLFLALGMALLSSPLFAGGVIPQGMGMYHDGRSVDTVPVSSDVIVWQAYGPGLDANMRDYIAFGAGSTDIETRRFRILFGDAAGEGQVQVSFSVKGDDPVNPACTDNNPNTSCPIAKTECLASTRQGSAFSLCSSYRIMLYINNKVIPPPDVQSYWVGVVRNQLGHVLGLWQDGTGAMANGANPFTACHLALWNLYKIDPNTSTWSYPPAPAFCNQ